MKKHITKMKGKKALSLLLAVIMVLSVASPAVSPLMGIIAKAATGDTIELAFDNLFIFEQWANNTLSTTVLPSGSSTIETDFAEGSFTLTNTDAAEVYTACSMDATNALNNEGYYTIGVEANTEYTFSYVISGTTESAETFVSYYDADGKCITYVQANASALGRNEWNFTTPENTARIQLRFDNNTINSSATFKDIKICKADTATNNDTTLPTRQIYTAGSGTYGELPTPATRDGYVFAGWFTGENGTGKRITADTNVFELSTTVYSNWNIEVQSLEIAYLPTKTEYTLNEKLNTTGLILKGTLADGSTITIDSGYYCTPEYLTNYGTRTITANYGGKSVTFKVNVSQFNEITVPVNDTAQPVTIANNEYTLNYTGSAFNRYELTYISDSYVKGVIDFGEDIEEFFLEPSDNGSFASYIDDFLTGKTQTNIATIKFTCLDNELGSFELVSVKTVNSTVPGESTQYYQNDEYKVGINLAWGGVLSYIQDLKNNPIAVAYADGTGTKVDFESNISKDNATSINKAVNLINTNDKGRYVQQSYYGTDQDPFEMGSYNGTPWRYNPVQGGNIEEEASKVVDYKITTDSAGNVTEIYVKTRPLDWGKNSEDYPDSYNTPSYMESRYVFEDGMIKTYCRFVDYSGYPSSVARQELPAFYCVEPLNTLVYYSGDEAWSSSNTKVTQTDLDFWGAEPEYTAKYPVDPYRTCTENWAAFMAGTDDNSYGIGVYSSGATTFSVGTFPNKYNDDGTLASRHAVTADPAVETPTSYISPLKTMTFKSYNPIEYSYYITTGTAEQIRYDFETVGNPKIQEELKNGKIAVPETVYLTPSTGASTTGQYYVNNILETNRYILTTEAVNNATAGKFQFYIPGAKSVKFDVSIVNGGDVTTAGVAENTAIIPNTKGYFTADNLTMSLGSGLTAGQTAVAEWKFTATMEDGTECIYYAYTTFYGPWYQPVGAAAKAKGAWHNVFMSTILWASGVHGYSDGDSNNRYYVQTANFLPMLNIIATPNNNNPDTNWIQSGSNGLSPTINYQSVEAGGTKYHARANSISPTANLTVDTSRYNNFNQIPNFKIGFMVTDTENGNGGKYYVSDFTGQTSSYYNGTATGGSQYTGDYNSQGTVFYENTNENSCGVKYNDTWNKAITGTGNYRIKSGAQGIHSASITSTAWNNNFVNINVTGVDKSTLRDLVIECSGFNEKNYTIESWANFKTALQNAAQVLGDPGATDVTTVATALETAITGLQTYLKFDLNCDDGSWTTTFGDQTALPLDNNGRGTTWTFAAPYAEFFSAKRDGYTFKGWSYSADTHYSDTENYFPADGTLIYGGFNQQFYAVWEGSPYTIVFNSNGGSGSMSSLSAKYGEEIRLTANAFTKEEATFAGWNTASNGSGTAYADGSTVKTASVLDNDTLTLYAQWVEPQKVNVTFDNLFDFDKFRDNIASSETTVEEVTDTGFTIKAISATKTVNGEEKFNDDCNTAWTYYIAIQPDTTYIVSADITHTDNTPNDGVDNYEVFADISDADYNHLSAQSPVENCKDEGGYMKATNTGTFKFTTSAAAAYVRLRFDPNDYQSVMTVNNIRVYEDKDITWGSSEVNRVVCSDGTYGELPPDPTRTGYTFDGWMNEQNNNEWIKADSYVGHDSTVYLTSQWTLRNYGVFFSTNGGSGSIDSKTVKYTDTFTLPDGLTCVGATFIGWALEEDAAEAVYSGGETVSVSKLTGIDPDNIVNMTFYAVWKLNEAAVVADNVVADSSFSLPFNPFKNDMGILAHHATDIATGYEYGFSTDNGATISPTLDGTYGKLSVTDPSSFKINYVLNGIMNGVETVDLYTKMTYKDDSTNILKNTITIAPASNMLYEESVLDFSGVSNTVAWSKKGNATASGTQEYDKDDVYGYDSAYAESTGFSNGTYLQADVTSTNKKSDTATFEFVGSGFDLISACGTNTGVQRVKIYSVSGSTKTLMGMYVVDTYFSDTSIMTNGLLHQVPVLNHRDSYGTYYVEVTALYLNSSGALQSSATAEVYNSSASVVAEDGTEVQTNSAVANSAMLEELGIEDVDCEVKLIWMDDNSILNGGSGAKATETKNTATSASAKQYFSSGVTTLTNYIDGIRIYNPLNGGNGYYSEAEQNPTYYNIVEELEMDTANSNKNMAYVEGNKLDYANAAWNFNAYNEQGGPKGEIYLKSGDAIAFKFNAKYAGTDAAIMLGMRAVQGSAKATITSTLNGTVKESSETVSSATEMYYDVSSAATVSGTTGEVVVIVANDGTGILAVNNLKLINGTLTSTAQINNSNQIIYGDNAAVLDVVEPVTPEVDENDTTEDATESVSETDVEKENAENTATNPGVPDGITSIFSLLEKLFEFISNLLGVSVKS